MVTDNRSAEVIRQVLRQFAGIVFGAANESGLPAPQHRETVYLSFSLSDPKRLRKLFSSAGFREIRVERIRREDSVESFDKF